MACPSYARKHRDSGVGGVAAVELAPAAVVLVAAACAEAAVTPKAPEAAQWLEVHEVARLLRVHEGAQWPKAPGAVNMPRQPGEAQPIGDPKAGPRREEQAGVRRYGGPPVGLLPEGPGGRSLLVPPVEVEPTTGM